MWGERQTILNHRIRRLKTFPFLSEKCSSTPILLMKEKKQKVTKKSVMWTQLNAKD